MSLQQELQQEERPAAQVRVTAEELAQAIAAVEARDGAAAIAHADTIALGEAVQQLGLQATPDELLAEVKARRQERVDPGLEKRQRRRRRLLRAGIALSVAANVLFLLLFLVMRSALVAAQHRSQWFEPERAYTDGTASGDIDLSRLQNGQTAYVTLYTLNGLAKGRAPALERGFYTQDTSIGGAQWMVVNLDGKLYVKGWAVKTADGGYDEVTSVQANTAPEQAPVTVPVERFRRSLDPSSLSTTRYGGDVPPNMPKTETVKLAAEKAGE